MPYDITTPYTKVDKVLTALSVKFKLNTYNSSIVFPDFGVMKESDKYRIYNKAGFFKHAPIKADGAKTAEDMLSFSEGTYTCQEYAIKAIVTDRGVQNTDAPIKPFIDVTNFLTEKVALAEEVVKFDLALTTLYGASATRQVCTSATCWKGGTGTIDILGDISAAIIAIVKATGRRPNIFGMETETYETMCTDSALTTILQNTTSKLVDAALPISVIRGLPISICDAVVNTADEGATETYYNVLYDTASTYKQCVVLAYVAPGDPLNFGVNFVSRGREVIRMRGTEGDDRGGTFVKVSKVFGPKVLNSGAGFIITNVLGA